MKIPNLENHCFSLRKANIFTKPAIPKCVKSCYIDVQKREVDARSIELAIEFVLELPQRHELLHNLT